jgi:hypothetical protein
MGRVVEVLRAQDAAVVRLGTRRAGNGPVGTALRRTDADRAQCPATAAEASVHSRRHRRLHRSRPDGSLPEPPARAVRRFGPGRGGVLQLQIVVSGCAADDVT